MGEGIIFTQSTDLWKAKRKATAHAFYKNRLVHMLDALKGRVIGVIDGLLARIEAS